MRISGYIQTVRPIHITDETEDYRTKIVTLPILDVQSGRRHFIPGIKATVLRGLLRKTASDIVNEQLIRHGVRIPFEVFNAVRHGSTSGRFIKEPVTPAIHDATTCHPLMGLFGGGPRGLSGSLHTPWMLPLCVETVNSRMVPEFMGVDNPPNCYMLICEDTIYPRLDALYNPDPDFNKVIESYEAKCNEVIASDIARRIRRLGEAEGQKDAGPEVTLRSSNLITYQYLMPGTLLHLDLTVEPFAPDHVKGFLLVVLARALNLNKVGGMQRIGFGVDVFSLPSAAANLKLDNQDEPVFEWDGRELHIATGGDAERLVDAFKVWHQEGKAWSNDTLLHATGFAGVDLSETPVRKERETKKVAISK